MAWDTAGLAALFCSSFMAATLVPAQSELALAGLLAAQTQPPWLLIATATAGNSLGACCNWLLGSSFYHLRERRWFPVSQSALERAARWYRRYGRWSLLGSWLPLVGDPITLAAGVLREPFWSFFCIMTAAKLGRYLIVAALALP